MGEQRLFISGKVSGMGKSYNEKGIAKPWWKRNQGITRYKLRKGHTQVCSHKNEQDDGRFPEGDQSNGLAS
jgi:hypothetical protein